MLLRQFRQCLGPFSILVVERCCETRLLKLLSTAQFIVEGFHKPLRLDVFDKSGSLLVSVRSYLLSRQLTKF